MSWADTKLSGADSDQSTGRLTRFSNTIVHGGAAAPEPMRARPTWVIPQKKASILAQLAATDMNGVAK